MIRDLRPYVEKDTPDLVTWIEMRNWRLSREWLSAHKNVLTPHAAGAMLRAAAVARAQQEHGAADDLALYAQLLDYAEYFSVDEAYQKLVGDEAFQDANMPSQTALLAQIREWMNAVNWAESRAYLEDHLAIISTEADSLIRAVYHELGDGDERATVREHLSILRLVREYGVTEGYQRFMLER
jgi:hypothetical protein